MQVQLVIKCSNADKFDVTANLQDSVVDFKKQIADIVNIPAAQQRLIHRGKVLKDELTLESYGVENLHTIHLVKGMMSSSPSTSPAATTPASNNVNSPNPSTSSSNHSFGLGGQGMPMAAGMEMLNNPELMQQMLNSPIMESMMSNPEIMQNMMLNNPQMQAMLDSNPQIRQILNDPSIMRSTLEMMRNPNALRELQRSQDLQMSQIENLPGGFNMLRQMYEQVQEPMMDAAQAAMNPSTSRPVQSSPPPVAPVNSALPNPWAAPSRSPTGTSNPMAGMGGMGGFGGGFGNNLQGLPAGVNPAAAMSMLSDPTYRQMMQNMLSDPATIQQMSAMNPQLGAALQNPQMRAMLTNPEVLQQLSNPSNMQAMMQMQQAMQTLQNNGFPIQGGLNAPNTGGLNFNSLFGSNMMGQQPAAASIQPPEIQFSTQLEQLQAMGFPDNAANIRALQATNGNVNAAVDRLLGL